MKTTVDQLDYRETDSFFSNRSLNLLKICAAVHRKSKSKDIKRLSELFEKISGEEYNWKHYSKRLVRSDSSEILGIFKKEHSAFSKSMKKYKEPDVSNKQTSFH